MSKEFVRNIKRTVLRGEDKEPLKTNIQNDLLSDSEDVFVRNQDEYHCLTDNLKDITSRDNNIEVVRTGKNTVELVFNGEGGGGGENPQVTIKVIENSVDYLTIVNDTPNTFEIGLTGEFITNLEQVFEQIGKIPDMTNYYNKEEVDTLIANIEVGDFTQVNSDWLEEDNTKPSFIVNKPIIPAPTNLDNYYDKVEVDDLIDGVTVPEFNQVKSDWLVTDDTSPAFIENKPTIPEPTNLDNYYDKVEVDDLIGGIDGGGGGGKQVISSSNQIIVEDKPTSYTLSTPPKSSKNNKNNNSSESSFHFVNAIDINDNNIDFVTARIASTSTNIIIKPVSNVTTEDPLPSHMEITIYLEQMFSSSPERQITFEDFTYIDERIPTTLLEQDNPEYRKMLLKMYKIGSNYILKLETLIP